jgi:polysaccharide biosynthesis/export protein
MHKIPDRRDADKDPSGPRRREFVLALAAAAAGCSPVSSLPPAPARPAEISGAEMTKPAPYRMQVGDVLGVRFMLNPELNEEVTVRPDGHISTALVTDELAYGRTVPDLTASLRRQYAKELKTPHVSVEVKSFAPTRVYVGGEVNNPGEFVTVGPTLTLSQAVSRAGGLKMDGDEVKVFIIRRGPNDVPEFFSTSYRNVITGRTAEADVRLAPYDVVYVPKTGVGEVYRFFNQYVQQFVPVSWGFSYVLPSSSSVTPIH